MMRVLVFVALLHLCVARQLPNVENTGQHDNLVSNDITYLGEINGKEFYVGWKSARQIEALYHCNSAGLTLAKLETQEEMDYIGSVLPSDGFIGLWYGAVTSFVHPDGTTISVSIINGLMEHYGLTFERYGDPEGSTHLVVEEDNHSNPFLCYKHTGNHNPTVKSAAVKKSVIKALYSSENNVSVLPNYLGDFNGKSFYLVQEPLTQQEAASRCLSIGFILAKLESQAETDWIKAKTAAYRLWVGGSPGFSHLDGTPVELVPGPTQYPQDGLQFIGYNDERNSGLIVSDLDEIVPYLCSD